MSETDKLLNYVAKPPQTKPEPAWHRLAKHVKDIDSDVSLGPSQVQLYKTLSAVNVIVL